MTSDETRNEAADRVRGGYRLGLKVVKCPLHAGSVDVYDPSDEERVMHLPGVMWKHFTDNVKAGLGDYDSLPDDPRKKNSPRFMG